MQRDERITAHQQLNRNSAFDFNALQTLIANVRDACIEKKVKKIGGLEPNDWSSAMRARAGNEPVIRLVYVIFRDMTAAKVQLVEALAIDPALMVNALQDENINIYYAVYPPN
jgi:hypothetical protein